MPPIKSLDAISSKWVRVSSVAGQSYAEGVANPSVDWKTATQAGVQNYKTAMADSLAKDTFAKSIGRSSTQNWRDNATSKGVVRWPEGIRLGSENYAKGFGPYRDVIQNTVLPARGPKGAPGNIQRVAKLAEALHNKKVQMSASGA
jgi:hypothetical protein